MSTTIFMQTYIACWVSQGWRDRKLDAWADAHVTAILILTECTTQTTQCTLNFLTFWHVSKVPLALEYTHIYAKSKSSYLYFTRLDFRSHICMFVHVPGIMILAQGTPNRLHAKLRKRKLAILVMAIYVIR